ncbi:hypothetical protein L1887_40561 [Cichorium endivia]|nr:hypothetical protein L1887_40561 [Cichorium endivia]
MEFNAAHSYILVNEEKVQPYLKMYEEILKELHPDMNEHDLQAEVDKNFASCDHQKDVAFQEDEVEANDIISTFQEDEVEPNAIISTTQEPSTSSQDEILEYGDISTNDSDDENNDDNEDELEYTTSTNEEEDDGEDDQSNDYSD